MKALFAALILFFACFILGSLGYALITFTSERVFGALYRMFTYHEEHPFQYIPLVAVCYALVGTVWWSYCKQMKGFGRFFSIVSCLLLTLLLASAPGGVLWKLHDMQAGYFPTGSQFWQDLMWGACTGLSIGWLVILLSFPYNLAGFILGALALHKLPPWVERLTQRRAQ